jgi:hypothetical protein
LTKTGSIWTSHEILATHELTVFFNQIGDDVEMRFDFFCSRGLVDFSKKSKRMADDTIDVLCSAIRSSEPRNLDPDRICVKCKMEIADDDKFCTHCGYDLDGKGVG